MDKSEARNIAHMLLCIRDRTPDPLDARVLGDAADFLRQCAEQRPELPAILFDGYSVFNALSEQAERRTSPENVSDVLDAVVRCLRNAAPQPASGERRVVRVVRDRVVLWPRDERPSETGPWQVDEFAAKEQK